MFVTLRDPWKDFERMRRDVERALFSPATPMAPAAPAAMAAPAPSGRRGIGRPPVELASDADHLTVTLLVPGADPASLAVTFEDGVLRIAGERPVAADPEGARFLRRERPAGRFERVLELPVPVEADRITAAYRDGVLRITLPKHAAARPRTIPISVN